MASPSSDQAHTASARAHVEGLAQRLLEAMPRLRVRLTPLMNNALSRGQLNLPQYNALSAVFLHGPLAMGQLTDALCVSTAAATNVVDRLVEMRLVERRRDQADRRVVLVNATAKGRRTVERFRRDAGHAIVKLLERLTPEAREQFVGIYERMTDLAWELPLETRQ